FDTHEPDKRAPESHPEHQLCADSDEADPRRATPDSDPCVPHTFNPSAPDANLERSRSSSPQFTRHGGSLPCSVSSSLAPPAPARAPPSDDFESYDFDPREPIPPDLEQRDPQLFQVFTAIQELMTGPLAHLDPRPQPNPKSKPKS